VSNTLPVHNLLDGIAESSAAVAPIKTGVAFFVSGLLQRVEPLDIVDHGSDTLRERHVAGSQLAGWHCREFGRGRSNQNRCCIFRKRPVAES